MVLSQIHLHCTMTELLEPPCEGHHDHWVTARDGHAGELPPLQRVLGELEAGFIVLIQAECQVHVSPGGDTFINWYILTLSNFLFSP